MQDRPQERNVFQPSDIKILKSALKHTSHRLKDQYGDFGPRLETVQLIAANAIVERAKSGDLKTEDLIEAGAGSVRDYLKWIVS